MAGTIIAMILLNFLNRRFKIENYLPEWSTHTKTLWWISIALLSTDVITPKKYDPTFHLLSSALVATVVYILYLLRDNQIAKSLLWALVPFWALSIVLYSIEFFFPSFYNENDGIFSFATLGVLVWFGAYAIGASRQQKSIAKQEEETKQIKVENKVLEELVNERTSEIQLQKNELEQIIVQLKATQAQLVQSEKLASLGELTAGIAHEIQNPLNFVNNFSELSDELVREILEEQAKQPSERDTELEAELLADLRSNLEKINHHGKRASGIVKSMLEHSRMSSGEKALTDLNALTDEYLRLAYHGLRAKDRTFNAKMETSFDETLPSINVVSQDVGRVLLNIINNAFQAVTERKEKLAATNEAEAYQPTVTVSTNFTDKTHATFSDKKAKTAIVTISDNGSGIPVALQEKVFQPFFTTKQTGKGTGLGLSLAYDIVKAHGGELTMQSVENQGVIFRIFLPVLQPVNA